MTTLEILLVGGSLGAFGAGCGLAFMDYFAKVVHHTRKLKDQRTALTSILDFLQEQHPEEYAEWKHTRNLADGHSPEGTEK